MIRESWVRIPPGPPEAILPASSSSSCRMDEVAARAAPTPQFDLPRGPPLCRGGGCHRLVTFEGVSRLLYVKCCGEARSTTFVTAVTFPELPSF